MAYELKRGDLMGYFNSDKKIEAVKVGMVNEGRVLTIELNIGGELYKEKPDLIYPLPGPFLGLLEKEFSGEK